MINKNKIVFYLILFSIFLFSCSHNPIDYSKLGNAPDITPTPIPLKFNFFTSDTTGDYNFYINIPSYLQKSGSAITRWGKLLAPEMNEIEFVASKIHGNSAYGYGVTFCVQPDTDPADPMNDDGFNFITLMINNNRQFTVFKVLNNKLIEPPMIELTQSDLLLEGYNRPNTINLKYMGIDSGNKKFRIIFNGYTESPIYFDYVKKAGEREIIINDRYGYIVLLAPKGVEIFPSVPVEVNFKQIIPEDIELIDSIVKSRSMYDFSVNNEIEIKMFDK